MNYLEIILPLTLLILSFVYKLFIDQSIDIPIAIKSLCELPVDMIFLSISFLLAFTISDNENRDEGLVYWVIFIIIASVVVFLWRRSVKSYDNGKNKTFLSLLAINLLITILCLITSINFLSSNKEKTEQTEQTEQTNNNNKTKYNNE